MPEKVERILFISLSCVGDVVMTTPVLQALHQQYPDAAIDIVGDQRSSILFSNCPYRGEVIHKDKKLFLRGVIPLVKKLRAINYDLIVDLRTDGVAYLLRGKKRYTKWHAHSYGGHSVEQHMAVIRSIHGERPIPNSCLWLDKNQEDFAKENLSVLPGKQWLVLAPGARLEKKIWPSDRYTLLANSLADIFSGVLLLGNADERKFTSEVSRGLSLPFVDMAGRSDLLQAAALLKQAAFFVGSDSGLGHVASAVSTPTLTYFSVDKPERCLPWGNEAMWLMGENQDARNIPLQAAQDTIRKFMRDR